MNCNSENKYVIFKLDNEFYGLNIDNVISIEKNQDYTRVPNAPKYVKGVINLRGEVTPIIDLREKLGLPSKKIDHNSRIIIVSIQDIIIGLIVDCSSEVLEIPKQDIDKPTTIGESKIKEYVKGIGKKEKRLIILLNLNTLLGLKE